MAEQHHTLFTAIQGLKTNNLQKISLNFQNIHADGALELSEILKFNSSLTSLNITSNFLFITGTKHLAKALEFNNTLKSLDLSMNDIKDEGISFLASALKVNKSLTTLVVQSNDIGTKGTKALSSALLVNDTLVTLNLDSNHIEDDGVIFLSEALSINESLKNIHLQHNNLTSTGISKLCQSKNSLNIVDLGQNEIGLIGFSELSKVLGRCYCTITDLSLSSTFIDPTSMKLLSESLKINTSLVHLALNVNQLTLASVEKLCDCLKVNKTLKSLNLERCHISNEGSGPISEALEINDSLVSIDLRYNFIGDSGIVRLSQALCSNNTITHFRISKGYIKDESAIDVHDLVKTNCANLIKVYQQSKYSLDDLFYLNGCDQSIIYQGIRGNKEKNKEIVNDIISKSIEICKRQIVWEIVQKLCAMYKRKGSIRISITKSLSDQIAKKIICLSPSLLIYRPFVSAFIYQKEKDLIITS